MSTLPKPTPDATQPAALSHAEPILKVIRRKCLDCSADQPAEVRHCPVTKCPLWPYRMGENPFAKPRGGFSRPFKNSPLIAEDSDGIGPSQRGAA
jgi:hypothetical protein